MKDASGCADQNEIRAKKLNESIIFCFPFLVEVCSLYILKTDNILLWRFYLFLDFILHFFRMISNFKTHGFSTSDVTLAFWRNQEFHFILCLFSIDILGRKIHLFIILLFLSEIKNCLLVIKYFVAKRTKEYEEDIKNLCNAVMCNKYLSVIPVLTEFALIFNLVYIFLCDLSSVSFFSMTFYIFGYFLYNCRFNRHYKPLLNELSSYAEFLLFEKKFLYSGALNKAYSLYLDGYNSFMDFVFPDHRLSADQ